MDFKYVQTTCPFCGTGCSMNLAVTNGKVSGTQPFQRSPVNEGRLCRKGGFCEEFINSPERLETPLIRKGDKLEAASWDEAFKFVAEKLKGYKPDEIACIASPRGTNEDIYATVKFASEVLKTKNIDNIQNLCNPHIGTGIRASVGFDASTGSIEDIASSKAVFLVGVDLYEQNPILISQIVAAKKAGAKVIYVNSKKTPTANLADLSIICKEGSESALMNAIMAEIISTGKADKSAMKVAGFKECKAAAEKASADSAEVSDEMVKAAAEILGSSGKTVYAFSSSYLSEAEAKSVANIAILTGNANLIYVLRDRNNSQGAIDLGAVPNGGVSATDVVNGKVKAVFFVADSPDVCECGCTRPVDALKKLEFVVAIDSIKSDITKAAHVVLPAAALPEKDGTQTNTERRVQKINKAVNAPGEAKPEWEIISGIASAMGGKLGWKSPEEIFAEITANVPAYKGITLEQVSKPEAPQWKADLKPVFTAVEYKEA